MTTALPRRRRPRGVNTKGAALQQSPGAKGFTLPEYLESHEVGALIAAAPNPQARLLILVQWRAGLRISEALALETRDLRLNTDRPTLNVRKGKGSRTRTVPGGWWAEFFADEDDTDGSPILFVEGGSQ